MSDSVNDMVFIGKVESIGERSTGISKKTGKPYAIDKFVLKEVCEEWPQSVSVEVFSTEERPRWKEWDIKEGEMLTVYLQFEAHEHERRWYNSIRAWKVERMGQPMQPEKTEIPAPFPADKAAAEPAKKAEQSQLPF